jgi:hypothetical protein
MCWPLFFFQGLRYRFHKKNNKTWEYDKTNFCLLIICFFLPDWFVVLSITLLFVTRYFYLKNLTITVQTNQTVEYLCTHNYYFFLWVYLIDQIRLNIVNNHYIILSISLFFLFFLSYYRATETYINQVSFSIILLIHTSDTKSTTL